MDSTGMDVTLSQSYLGSGKDISGPHGSLIGPDVNGYFLAWCNSVWNNKHLDTSNAIQVKTSLRRSCRDTR
jgi:hypothetical protein